MISISIVHEVYFNHSYTKCAVYNATDWTKRFINAIAAMHMVADEMRASKYM